MKKDEKIIGVLLSNALPLKVEGIGPNSAIRRCHNPCAQRQLPTFLS